MQSISPRTKNIKNTLVFNGKSVKTEHKRRTHNNENTNLVSLVNKIPNTIDSYERFLDINEAVFAMQLREYFKANHNKHYNSISFNPKTESITNYIIKLSEYLFDNGVHMLIIDENTTAFIEQLTEYVPDLIYTIDANNLLKSPKKELKIGFAHLLKKIQIVCDFSPLSNKSITSLSHTHIENLLEINSATEDYDLTESDPIFSKENQQQHIITYNKILKAFHLYSEKDIKIFENYKPKNKEYQKIKRVISKALKINYKAIYKFRNSIEEENSNSFTERFQMLFNRNNLFENLTLDNLLEVSSWNGLKQPCKFIEYTKEKITSKTEKTDVKELLKIMNAFVEINDSYQDLIN